MKQIPATYLRQIFLILLIAGIFGVLFANLRFFLPALLGAYTLYVLLRRPLFYLMERRKWPVKPASAVMLLLSFVVVLLPFNWVVVMLRERVVNLFKNSDQLMQNAEVLVLKLEKQYGITVLTPENLKSVNDWLLQQVQQMVGATFNGLGLLVATYFILWFMLTEGKKMEQSFFNWLPLRAENVEYLRKHLDDLVWGNALGIPLMGVVQGAAGLLIYWIVGIEDPWMWFAVTFVAGMMPVVGVALAYVPLSLLLLSQGQDGKALIVFLSGVVIVGSVDNIARMWLLKKISHTHPMVTLFGVIAGLQLFGFIGFVFGPILIALFLLLIRIYHKEFYPAATAETPTTT